MLQSTSEACHIHHSPVTRAGPIALPNCWKTEKVHPLTPAVPKEECKWVWGALLVPPTETFLFHMTYSAGKNEDVESRAQRRKKTEEKKEDKGIGEIHRRK